LCGPWADAVVPFAAGPIPLGEEWIEPMTELRLILDFSCCACAEPVTVTLHCTGEGLETEAAHQVASVNVPCPSCGQVNCLYFEPCGKVRGVRPHAARRALPTPSLN
jgi:hypothetical protein